MGEKQIVTAAEKFNGLQKILHVFKFRPMYIVGTVGGLYYLPLFLNDRVLEALLT